MENIFFLTKKFFFNFGKVVYGFQNRKLFSNFEHFILKSTSPVKTRPGLA
jgi:hypothetical protein